ncbi:MAG: YbhB/YbcL family Raf kinase inhibitor-like protein [Micrococcales bacterium]|nr:MAG: YbhB/YbcL family Raf kinase inhibitor-like protein [Micrococcales bacterium]PIE26825.1 MAG: YbhB/YbcL family Raf kinase inhibitor-like protein [Micrococcales bacterium]
MTESVYASMGHAPAFSLTSSDVSDGAEVPPAQRSGAFGVPGGQDVSPQLSWSGFPEGTKSFAVTLYDPDAPTTSGFWHWVVLNIPASVTELPTGAGAADSPAMPAGSVTLRNDAGVNAFVGAGPPPGHGDHRYVFAVHALDVESVDVDSSGSPAFGMFNLFGHVIGRAELTTTFGH